MRSRNVFASLASCAVVVGQQPCTTEENGLYYDLTALQAKQDYELKTDTGRVFMLNLCGPVNSETWKIDNPSSVGGFYRGDSGDVSIGVVNSTLRIVDSDPLVVLTNGSPCKQDSSLHASTAIRFMCDNNVFGPGKPQLIAQLPPDDDSSCAFIFEWRTHVACPTSKPSRIGALISVVAALALILFLSYVVVGVLYRRFVLGYNGIDQLPRISLIPLSAFPRSLEDALDWLRDIRDHIRGGARDLWPRSSANGPRPASWGRHRGDGFAPLAQEEQEAMFRDSSDAPDARFSLEDDIDHEGARELTETSLPATAKDTDRLQGGTIRL